MTQEIIQDETDKIIEEVGQFGRMPFNSDQLRELARVVDPTSLKKKNGLSYIEPHDIITHANEIFGIGNWGYKLITSPQLVTIVGKDEKLAGYLYWCAIQLHVFGANGPIVPIEEVGSCPVSNITPDGFDTAVKGCVTDAMKRALSRLGDPFGLRLYDRDVFDGQPDKPKEKPRQPQTYQASAPASTGRTFDAPKPVSTTSPDSKAQSEPELIVNYTAKLNKATTKAQVVLIGKEIGALKLSEKGNGQLREVYDRKLAELPKTV